MYSVRAKGSFTKKGPISGCSQKKAPPKFGRAFFREHEDFGPKSPKFLMSTKKGPISGAFFCEHEDMRKREMGPFL